MKTQLLHLALVIAGLAQLGICVLNFFLIRLLHWENDLARMDALLREVFYVHKFFISLVLAIFGAFTLRFAQELAAAPDPHLQWVAASIGIFWALRATMQWTHYSRDHWRGNLQRTVIHWTLFLGYFAFAITYSAAAWIGEMR